MTARAVWTMPAEIIAEAEGRWERVDKAIKTGILAGEILLAARLKTNYLSGDPVRRVSGNLSRAVFYEPTSIGAMTGYYGFVGIGPEAPYARFVNDGTEPHYITAHGETVARAGKSGLDTRGIGGAKTLRFEIGGEVIYRREVYNPGIRARHFMETALEENAVEIIEGIETRARTALVEKS